MEERIANIIVGAAGGTAAKDSKTYKVSLPTAWVKELGLAEGNTPVRLSFDGESIVLAPQFTVDEFLQRNKQKNHRLKKFSYYDGDVLCTQIGADFTEQTVVVENFTDNIVKTAFGRNRMPTWVDFMNFLEERCVPSGRASLREYLEAIGLDAYDPLRIIERTKGRMAEDNQWIETENIV